MTGWLILATGVVGQVAVRRGTGTSVIMTLLASATPAIGLLVVGATLDAALRRHWRRLLVASALCAAVGSSVLPAVRAERQVPAWAADTDRVRILAVNGYFMNGDPDFERSLRDASATADVVVLSEAGNNVMTERLFADQAFGDRYRHRVWSGDVIVFSRYPLDDVVRVNAGGPAATVLVRSPRPFRLVGVHAKAPVQLRSFELHDAFFAWAGTEFRTRTAARVPLVMAGDFNASRWQPPMRRLLDAGAHDAHESVGAAFATTWPVLGGGWRRLPPFLHLDHVLVNDGVAVLRVEDVRIAGSDHEAVLADIVIDPDWTAVPEADGTGTAGDDADPLVLPGT